MTWTHERVESLKQDWADGFSASQIGSRLSMPAHPLTRNAVLGKIHRLGLASRASHPRVAAQREPRVARLPKPPKLKATEIIEIPPDTSPCAISIEDIGMNHCRYPLGDPQKPGFMFCGADKLEHSPYCGRHHRLTHTNSERRGPAPTWKAAW